MKNERLTIINAQTDDETIYRKYEFLKRDLSISRMYVASEM